MSLKSTSPLCTILALIFLFSTSDGAYAAEIDFSFPQNTELILLVRPNLPSHQDNLGALLSQNRIVAHYRNMLELTATQVEYAAIFMPYDPAWLDNATSGAAETVPDNGAIILKGAFSSQNKYKSLKSKGWKERKHANKTLLWWSTGETYLESATGGDCFAKLGEDKILMASSEESIKSVLDVIGGKEPEMESMGTFQEMTAGFLDTPRSPFGLFVRATEKLRQKIKSEIEKSQSSTVKSAAQYVDNVQEASIYVIDGTENLQFNGFLGMNSGNSALIITSVLQAGAGMAGFLQEDNPLYQLADNLTIARNAQIVSVRTLISRKHAEELLENGRR